MKKHMAETREGWLTARLELLRAEKELTRRSDELARRGQDLSLGTPIARLHRECLPLDDRVFPPRASAPADNLTRDPPSWILTSDLPIAPYRESTLVLLRWEHAMIAHAETRRFQTLATLGEEPAPVDWKYTHATYNLYRKTSP